MKTYDLSRYQRLVGVEGGLVTGTFAVLLPVGGRDRTVWVRTHDVTVWHDPEHRSGRVLYSGDLTGSVQGGVAEISEHMIGARVRDDVLAVKDEMKAALVAVVAAALEVTPDA